MGMISEFYDVIKRRRNGDGKILNGEYRVLEMLKPGAHGCVYKAVATNRRQLVAVKVIPAIDAKRIGKEGTALALLDHSNIVKIHSCRRDDDKWYLVMDYVDGTDLECFLKGNHPFYINDAVRIICELLDALEHVHEKKIYHRDIKPANIMLDKKKRVKLTDFGVAHIPPPSSEEDILSEVAWSYTHANTTLGTPGYMPPEQYGNSHAIGNSADLFSVGVILYIFLTGEKPFSGKIETIEKNQDAPSERNHTINSAFDAVVARALRKEPDERYQNAADFRKDTMAALEAAMRDKNTLKIKLPCFVDAPLQPIARQPKSQSTEEGLQVGVIKGKGQQFVFIGIIILAFGGGLGVVKIIIKNLDPAPSAIVEAGEAKKKKLNKEAKKDMPLETEVKNKRLEEDAKNKRLEEDAKNKRLEEDAKNKRLEEDAKNKRLEEDAKNKRLEEDAKNKRLEEDAKNKRLKEEAKNKRLEEEAKNKRLEEEAKNKRLEEEAKNKRLEEEAKNKRLEEEIKKNKQLEEDVKKNSQSEEDGKNKLKTISKKKFGDAQALNSQGRVKEALPIYIEAALAGYGPAAKRVFKILLNGEGGVPPNYAEAQKWRVIAIANGESIPLPDAISD